MDPLATFTTNLRVAREAAGMSQEEVALAAGVGQSHYSRIETGVHDPSVRMVAKIAEAIGVKAADLMDGV